LIESDLQCKGHRFEAPDYRSQPLPRGYSSTEKTAWFEPKAGGAPAWLRNVVGKNSKPNWWAPALASEILPMLDLRLAEHCRISGDWDQVKTAWLSMLVRPVELLVWHETLGDAPVFSLGDLSNVGALGWPATCLKIESQTYWFPNPKCQRKALKLFFITDVAGWTSCNVEWVSPLQARILSGSPTLSYGVLAREVGQRSPLLETASRAAFWDFTKATLLQIAKYLGLAVLLSQDL
jgi:hypothetical protein